MLDTHTKTKLPKKFYTENHFVILLSIIICQILPSFLLFIKMWVQASEGPRTMLPPYDATPKYYWRAYYQSHNK